MAAVVVPPDFETMAAESIEASFRDSANREREQFAAAERFSVTTGAPSGNENPRTITAEGQRILTESELAGARTLSATEQNAQGKWVKVATSVSTYEPGSMVYLVATSEPIVFGTVKVSDDGKATLAAAIPLKVLGPGAHRFRVVGKRDLGGVTIGPDGSIVISDATIAEIRKFDTGTTATARIKGQASGGGSQELVRYIPLREPTPWYWLLVPILVGLVLAFMKRRRRLLGQRFKGALLLSAAAGLVPAFIGWWGMFFDLGFVGLLLVPIIPIILIFVRVRAREEREPRDRGPAYAR